MNPLDITFVMRGLTSTTLYYGKSVRYKGSKIGTITNWKIGEDRKIYITARINSKSFIEKIANEHIMTGFEINEDKKSLEEIK